VTQDGETQRIATVPANCTSVDDCASKIRIVTRDIAQPVATFKPTWSPDGKQIAYVYFRFDGPDLPILGIISTIRCDGSNARQISDPAYFSFRPDWAVIDDD
jgi:WD40-like Beta Propeller Repeat